MKAARPAPLPLVPLLRSYLDAGLATGAELGRLPELGPIGANGLANPRDFLAPAAAFEDLEGSFHLTSKFLGRLWQAEEMERYLSEVQDEPLKMGALST